MYLSCKGCCLPFFLCSAVPLYQDYCLQAVKEDLHRLNKSFVSELITPQYLQGLQSRLSPPCHSEATSPQLNPPEATPSSPLPHPIRVTPCTLWQDLDEVKASGLLSSLTTRDIRLQEVWKAQFFLMFYTSDIKLSGEVLSNLEPSGIKSQSDDITLRKLRGEKNWKNH